VVVVEEEVMHCCDVRLWRQHRHLHLSAVSLGPALNTGSHYLPPHVHLTANSGFGVWLVPAGARPV
jgi:hypothetical protein